jgi:hypothetical protein
MQRLPKGPALGPWAEPLAPAQTQRTPTAEEASTGPSSSPHELRAHAVDGMYIRQYFATQAMPTTCFNAEQTYMSTSQRATEQRLLRLTTRPQGQPLLTGQPTGACPRQRHACMSGSGTVSTSTDSTQSGMYKGEWQGAWADTHTGAILVACSGSPGMCNLLMLGGAVQDVTECVNASTHCVGGDSTPGLGAAQAYAAPEHHHSNCVPAVSLLGCLTVPCLHHLASHKRMTHGRVGRVPCHRAPQGAPTCPSGGPHHTRRLHLLQSCPSGGSHHTRRLHLLHSCPIPEPLQGPSRPPADSWAACAECHAVCWLGGKHTPCLL